MAWRHNSTVWQGWVKLTGAAALDPPQPEATMLASARPRTAPTNERRLAGPNLILAVIGERAYFVEPEYRTTPGSREATLGTALRVGLRSPGEKVTGDLGGLGSSRR
jgi:hypothetical protein